MSETDTSKLNLYQKILKIMEEVGTIEKTGKNQLQHYDFIEQGMIVAELRPQLAKWGVVILPETVDRTMERYDVTRGNGKAGVDVHVSVKSRYTVVNADNPDERFIAEWDAGEAIDSGDKATNKAVTASNKTYLMKLFNISDKEDADAESPTAASAAQRQTAPKRASAEQIGQMLKATGELTETFDRGDIIAAFVKIFKVEPNKVPAAKVDSILKRIAEAKAKKADADMQAEAESAQESAAAPDDDLDLNIAKEDEHDAADYLNGGERTALMLLVGRTTGLEDQVDIIALIEEVARKPIDKILKSEVEGLKTTIKHRQLVADKQPEGES